MRDMVGALKFDLPGNDECDPICWIPDHQYLEDHERFLIRPLGVRDMGKL